MCLADPIISNLTVNWNTTSTVIPVIWKLQSNGGYSNVTFTVWVKLASSGSYHIWKDNIQLDVKEGDEISVDVDTLVPNKHYDLKVMAQSNTSSGDIRSTPLYTSGLTRGQ